MPRSDWKIPYLLINTPNPIPPRFEIFNRAATISPNFIDRRVCIHNGNRLLNITITENHIGFKFGQFALTKKRVFHKKKQKRK
jgi:ribosomal protein S19